MHRLSILVPVLTVAFGLGLATCAQAAPPTIASDASTGQQVAAPAASSSEHQLVKPGDRNCLQHTGSLLPPKKGECLPVVGKSYSGAELRRTGTQNTARALQMLDPSISVGH
ncbi:MAG TPA: hypothetical protein VN043_15980 [Rhodanobacter sp.]|nr:hypothetical protein [Rhodanobacter sp.]